VILVEPAKNGHGAISLDENRSITLRSGLPKERERNQTEHRTEYFMPYIHDQIAFSAGSNQPQILPLLGIETIDTW
jgi:hypothetical protein